MKSTAYRSRLKAASCFLLFIVLFLGTRSAATAQQTAARPDRGLGPVGAFSGTSIDTVNLTNGNLNVNLPLASLPPVAGGKVSFGLTAVYNSKLWNVVRHQVRTLEEPIYDYVEDLVQMDDNGGWKIPTGFNLFPRDSRDDVDWVPPLNSEDGDFGIISQFPNWFKTFFTTPDGAEHELKPLGFSPFPGGRPYLRGYYKDNPTTVGTALRYYTFDGSYIWAKVNKLNETIRWEVYMPDGMKIFQRNDGIQRIEDTNGNKIKIFSTTDANGVVTRHIVDEQTGREIKTEIAPGSLNTKIWYQTVNQTWVNIQVNYGTTLVFGKTYETSVPAPLGGDCILPVPFPVVAVDVIREIILPQTEPGVTKKYTFNYNSDGSPVPVSLDWYGGCNASPIHISQASPGYGSLSEIQFPSGAKTNYSYSLSTTHEVNSADEFARERVTGKILTHDNMTEAWTYTLGGSVQGPDGSITTESAYPSDSGFPSSFGGTSGLGGLVFKTDYSGKKIVERRWIRKKFNGADDTTTSPGVARFNTVLIEEYTTIVGSPSMMSAKVFDYDFNGNMVLEKDYDWFSPSLVQREGGFTNLPLGVPSQLTPLRTTTYSYYNDSTAANSSNVYAKRVIGSPPTPLVLDARKQIIVGPSDTRMSYDNQPFGTAPTVGNLTKVSNWDDQANKFLDTLYGYDGFGNQTSVTDPKLNVTSIVYDSATHAQPVSVTVDPLNGTGSQSAQTFYDYATGLVLSQTDANSKTTTYDYTNQLTSAFDPFGRPGVITAPAVTSTIDGVNSPNQQRKTVAKYFDNARQVETIADLKQQSDGLLKTRTSSDQVGRVILVETSENTSSYTIKFRSAYEPTGRITYISNPTRDNGATTDGWTRTTSDEVGRVVETATFKGAGQPPLSGTNANWTGSITTSYNAEQTTVTDQAGKKRRSIVDGLGRPKQLDELNENGTLYATTSYVYDALDNLKFVTQGGQQRQFDYDSLSRLIKAFNPEQVNTSLVKQPTVYEYDDASNLKKRTNPNQTTITYTYDGLHRLASKTLSTGGAWTYNYDTGTNGKGRLASVVKQGGTDGTYYDGYDAMGRVTASHQITDGNNYALSYGYDLAGNMTKEVYPSNKEVRTSYDGAGRISGLKRYNGGVLDKTYTSSYSYTAHGAVASMQLGNLKWEHTNYNSRLQPTQIGLGDNQTGTSLLGLDYTYGVIVSSTLNETKNNGTIESQSISAGGVTIKQSYTYDQVSRLLSVSEKVNQESSARWTQSYGYDQWGNRTGLTNTGTEGALLPTQSTPPVSSVTNRLTTSGYDTSGNQTQNAAGQTFGYDSENHQVSFNGSVATYSYDEDGRRVKKVNSTGTTLFVYDIVGRLIAEYTSGPAAGSGTSYLTTDHLRSTRVVTNGNGGVKARYDYLPFGEEIGSNIGNRNVVGNYGGADTTRQRFTSKERDEETKLDYFGARYYSSAQGRFTSADAPFAGQSEDDPQSWNLYTYGRNNPLLYIDPTGTDYILFDSNGRILFLKDSAFEGNNPDFEFVSASEDGNHLVLRDKDGTEWSGDFVDASEGANKSGRQDFDYFVFDLKDHVQKIQEYDRTPFLRHLHGNQRPRGNDSTKFFKKSDRPVEKAERKMPEPRFKNDAEAAAKAKELGYTKINERSHDQAVFRKGNSYITRDVDGHNGGAWKMANSVKDLGSKSTRLGTYDENLVTRVGN